ncbi:MAG: hypothetical protein KVP17_002928 [Porospora cf. gigantea B]|uniref:uncharacterized protein n=2 Tax=Porospora cf. gigantea B TaxID=2853592 RepID=UPI003571BD62|nr:MAG: hypothetical protein KVP17_002928 [Porospora cf. gigantea B]
MKRRWAEARIQHRNWMRAQQAVVAELCPNNNELLGQPGSMEAGRSNRSWYACSCPLIKEPPVSARWSTHPRGPPPITDGVPAPTTATLFSPPSRFYDADFYREANEVYVCLPVDREDEVVPNGQHPTHGVYGVPSPLSPLQQPTAKPMNYARLCVYHYDDNTAATQKNGKDCHPHLLWQRTEPLVTPPLCSCDNPKLRSILEEQGLVLDPVRPPASPMQSPLDTLSAVSPITREFLSPMSPAVLPEPREETEGCIDRVCNGCGGLLFFPHSFIQIPMTRDWPLLSEVSFKFNLPGSAVLYCDQAKHVTVIVSSTAAEEVETLTALSQSYLKLDEAVLIFDVCSSHFVPFATPPASYMTDQYTHVSLLQSAPHERPESPPKAVQNIIHFHERLSGWNYGAASFANKRFRRPYCIRPRANAHIEILAEASLLQKQRWSDLSDPAIVEVKAEQKTSHDAQVRVKAECMKKEAELSELKATLEVMIQQTAASTKAGNSSFNASVP